MKQNKILMIIIIFLLSIIIFLGIVFYKTKTGNLAFNHSMLVTGIGGNNMMEEHCKMMPEMSGCEKYNLSNKTISNDELVYGNGQKSILEKKQEIVNLKDGDSYIITIDKIKKNINGNQVDMLAYNGSIPGPIIKAKVGSKVKITLVNNVSDLETTLHSHGLRLSDMFDGVIKDMMGKQDPIKTGDKFTYDISFPDVGVFWYHPHMREDIQQELGLYGNYIVEPQDDTYYSKVNREGPIMLDDIAMDSGNIKPFYKDFTNYVLMGRFGNVSFINGKVDYKLQMKTGEVVRVYFTDVANTRVFNLKIPGIKMKLIGSDNGLYEKESFIDNLIISPGERYIVDLYAPNSGNFDIQNDIPGNPVKIGNIEVLKDKVKDDFSKEFNVLKENKSVILDISKFQKYFDKKVDKSITLELGHKGMKGGMGDMGMGMMGDSHDGIEYEDSMPQMNENSNSQMLEWKIIDQDTKNENMSINWHFKKGDVVKIKIKNKKDGMHPMQHPFHLHGQRFLVLTRDGINQTNLVWKDTVLIKTGETVEILADMNNTGEWMAHCHISEHLFSGMMMHFSVK